MKEVIDVINLVITQVKEYIKVLKLKDSGDKFRFYKIIKPTKFYYDNNTFQNLLTDSLARTTNSFNDGSNDK
jgi:hypothetical protein